MAIRTLENYFDDWNHVQTTVEDFPEKLEWAAQNIGMRGLEWDAKLTPSQPKRGQTLRFSAARFKFKSKNDAFLFLLTFGGEIINHGEQSEKE